MRNSITVVLVLSMMVGVGHARAGEIYSSHAFRAQLGTIAPANGAGRDIGPYNLGMFQAQTAFDNAGRLYTLSIFNFPENTQTRLATVDTSTGTATAVSPLMDGFFSALEIDNNNKGYVIQYVDEGMSISGVPTFYTMDITNGELTAVADSKIERAMDTAIDSDGKLWVVGGADGGNRLYTIDPTTGTSQFKVAVTGVPQATGIEDAEIMGIMFDEKDVLYGTAFVENSPLFTINTSTGATTVRGDTGFLNPHGGDYLVPEPSALALGFLGLLCCVTNHRRRAKTR